MFKPALPLFASALMLAAVPSAHAAETDEAWTPTATSLRANGAGLNLPQAIGKLALHKSGEASNGGKGIDNYAQYLSDDGEIQATFYVYLPGYADAFLAAYMTDKAIMERFGENTRRSSYGSVPLAGHADGAIRAIYDDAGDGTLTTAAAFVHAGRWLVKLRVTGPAERRTEVLADIDAMLKAIKFDDPASLHTAKLSRLAACPDGDSQKATAATASSNDRHGFCIRGKVNTANGAYDMLQTDGTVIVPVDDAGTILTLNPVQNGGGYQLAMHSLGKSEFYGVYDKMPSAGQIAAILDGKDPATAKARTVRNYAVSR